MNLKFASLPSLFCLPFLTSIQLNATTMISPLIFSNPNLLSFLPDSPEGSIDSFSEALTVVTCSILFIFASSLGFLVKLTSSYFFPCTFTLSMIIRIRPIL